MERFRAFPAVFFLFIASLALVWGGWAAFRPEAASPAGSEAGGGPRPADPEEMLRRNRALKGAEEVGAALARVLDEQGVSRGDIRYETRRDAPGSPIPRTEMAIDVRGEAGAVASALAEALGALGSVQVERRPHRASDGGAERLSVRRDGAELYALELFPIQSVPSEKSKPRIAIVIDDIGYTKERVHELLALSNRLTFAVLPYGPYVVELAGEIHARGAEVMLHMPMEPRGKPGGLSREGMLLDSMPEEILRTRLAEALLKVPHATGVNNHMGSHLTTRREAMDVVMDELVRRDLLFVDSRTSVETVAYRAARDRGVRAVERDVFLDDVAEVGAILVQIEQLEARARKRGSALAIGHPYPATVRALQIAVPRMLERGFEIVPASELAGRVLPATRQAQVSP